MAVHPPTQLAGPLALRAERPSGEAPGPRLGRATWPWPAPRIPDIAGVWRDVEFPTNGSQITQSGDRFDFSGWGYLPNGVEFRSIGSGTLTPQSFSSRYEITYQTGLRLSGTCTGTVSGDGSRMQMTCSDTMLGTFPITSVRQ